MKMKELKNADLQEVNGGFDGLLPQFPQYPTIGDFPWIDPVVIPVIWQ
jgi:hypothetical protein